MRCSSLTLVAFLGAAGCAQDELRPAAAPSSPPAWGEPPSVVQQEPPPPPRPRLSQTVTLGQDDYAPNAPSAAPVQGQGQTTNVTVNNNIVVQQPPIYGGYYGGYGGYGSYGGARGEGRGTTAGATRPAWAPSGWEGAQRTAAPGQTPGVGGNWAPVQDSGPRPMR